MNNFGKWTVAIAMACFVTIARAQDASGNVGVDFSKFTKPKTDVMTLGPDLFGDQVSMYTGAAEFRTMDVSIPGNNSLSVAVGRRYIVEDRHDGTGMYPGMFLYPGLFGDWELDVPHLHGIFAAISSAGSVGWQVSTSGLPNQRCSVDTSNYLSATPPNENGSPAYPFSSAEYWYGNSVYIPGDGDQKMLVISQGDMDRPSDGRQYYWATSNKWVFSCLTSTANGVAGEGFLGISPTGTKYWFNWIVARPYKPIQKPYGVCANGCAKTTLNREEDWIFPTKIQDRFGNTVTYTYDPANPWHLLNIVASDGRQINLSYNPAGRIATATANGKTWTYSYDASGGLIGVSLPDNSTWSLSFSKLAPAGMSYSNGGDCGDSPILNGSANVQVTLTHPSGAVGVFTFSARRHGRSNVPQSCVYTDGGGSYPAQSDVIDVLSIDSKQISGAGFTSPLLWTYSYGPANSSYAQQCTTSCPTTKNVTVTNPDGSWAIHTYSNKYNSAEGKELEVQIGKGGATSSTENKSYLLDPGGQPYPALIGQSPCNRCDPDGEIYQPLKSQTINQDGVNYTYTVNAFDVFARAVNVTKNNSLGYAKTEVTQYSDNFSSWVVGQIARTTANGIEVDRFDYDPTTALPIDYYRFGALKKNLSYNADGTLYQIKDGLGNTTTLSNWKRGIPQYATYADGAQESLSVDDSGNVTSVTDQMGSTTSYSYDSVGRVTQTTYPSGDEQPWYPAVYTYNFVNTAERGVAANHWRRTITKGTLSQTTLYDVFWRPILNDTSNVNDSSSHISSRIDYDWLGNKVFVSYPVSGAPDIGAISVGTNTSFDALNRPVSTQQTSELGTLTSSTTYLSGAKTQVTDPKGNITTTSYQSFDTPSYDEPILIQAPAGITQTITRDIFGSATAITQSGAYGNETDSVTKTLVYDANHRLCRTIEPESGSTVVAYDAADNVVWSAMGQNITGSDCGQDQVATSARTIRTYDAINRVKTVTPPVGTQATTYSYDQLGNLYSAVSGTSVWMASHNKLGQLTREALQVNGQNPWTIGYQHDGYGSLNVITYPDGETATYAPDAMGRATQVSGYASGVTYFPNGQVAGFNFGNGASYVAEQNARQLLSNFSYGIGSTLALSEDYSYDADSNITKVSDIVNGQRTKTFSYDTLNRLTGATANNLYGTENYTYDPLNNLRSRLTAGTTLTFNYDAANHLANVMQDGSVTTSFGYDVQGNRASLSSGGVTKQYLFDAENQLLQIPGLEGYGYDAAGRRVSKTPNDRAPTYYFYNQSGQLLYQWDSAVGTSTNFFYLGTKLVAKDALAGGVNTGSTGVSVLFPPSYSSTGYYTVSWYNITGASSYELQSVVNGVWTTIYVGSTNGYDISGAASGIYQYRVRACASTGNCGAWSAPAEVTVNTQAPSPTPALAPLLMVNRSGIPANYTVLWTGVDKAATYNLQEQYKGGAWATVYSGSNGSWNATNKPIGGYAYQVQACNGAGCGPWCPAVTIQVIVDMSPIINLILDDN